MILRLFKGIFRESEALNCECEVFIKITRRFEDIFREMKGSIRTFSENWKLF
jgi:hypothetical protein